MTIPSSRSDRRRFLRDSALATAGIAAGMGVRPLPIGARLQQGGTASRGQGTTSLSRQFAQWVVGLRYEDLPAGRRRPRQGPRAPEPGVRTARVADAAGKQAWSSSRRRRPASERRHRHGDRRQGHQGRRCVRERGDDAGGRQVGHLPHAHPPGTAIIPAALVAAENRARRDATSSPLVAGYEVMERMAADWIPTVMARGFHAGPVFSIFGAAIAAAKILDFDEDQVHAVISLCTNLAGSNLESRALREGAAVRNAMLAVALAKQGRWRRRGRARRAGRLLPRVSPEQHGDLTYSFTGDDHTSLDKLTVDLGTSWMFLETLYRIYSIAGYNIAHIDVTARLCEEHDIRYQDVDRVEAEVNWLETQYPSPAFPTQRRTSASRGAAARGSTARTAS